ncbi:cytochrome b [Pontibacter sp. JAM-7]|uniref:cytochrome b n=1 Tax=Pontibacter sp. JAM-7 TaxID=3366581 RepID=UPI003AF7C29F
MSLRNSPESYGSIAKWLHWSTALLFLGSYVSVYYREWFTEPKTPENITAIQLHLSIGVTIAVIVLLRIIWKLSNQSPKPEGTPLQKMAAKAGHGVLYLMMIVMPITGYLGTGAPVDFFFMFEIPSFKDTALFAEQFAPTMTFKEFEKPFDLIHKAILGELLLWILILGHAGAALYHHFVQGDRTLKRMTSDT